MIFACFARIIRSLSSDYNDACGAVESLSRRCDALSEGNRRLHKELGRLLPQEQIPDMPMGQRIEGESEDAQSARFRRYILEYQSYLRIMERRAETQKAGKRDGDLPSLSIFCGRRARAPQHGGSPATRS